MERRPGQQAYAQKRITKFTESVSETMSYYDIRRPTYVSDASAGLSKAAVPTVLRRGSLYKLSSGTEK